MTSIRDDIATTLSFNVYEFNGRRVQVSGWLHDEEDPETGQQDYFIDLKYLDNGKHERIPLRRILENPENITMKIRCR